MKTRKSIVLILALALMLSVFVLPGQIVQAQSVIVSMPATASVGQTIQVHLSISPAVNITTGFDVTISYDAAGLQYAGGVASISTMTPYIPGSASGSFTLGYSNGNATAGSLFTLNFVTLAAGTYAVSAGEASYGVGYASGAAATVQVQAAAQPPPVTPTPTPLPTVGPTPGPTVPPVTLPNQTAGDTEPPATEPETGEEKTTFYTFDGKPLVVSEQEIPAELIRFDYVQEEVSVSGETVRILRADRRPRLFWLETPEGVPGLYLYWQAEDRYVPYRLLSPITAAFVIMPPPSDAVLPDGFTETELTIDGTVYPAYQADAKRYRPLLGGETGTVTTETGATGEVLPAPAADLPEIYVVYARVQREAEATAAPAETPAEETTAAAAETIEGETTAATTAATAAEPEAWEEGEFYFYDRQRSMLFPLSLMLMQIPEVTPTPEPTVVPTPVPTETIPVETIPVGDAEPVVRLFGYEYGLWKAIIFVLGFLLLLTWLILLIRSLGRKSRDVERAKVEAERRKIEDRQRLRRERSDAAYMPVEKPLQYSERPNAPEPQLIVPPSAPLSVDPDDAAPADDDFRPAKTRDNLPDMPTLKSPRPAPLPPVRNVKRTHADEMVLRPLPTEPDVAEPAETLPEAPVKPVLPERPVIRRIEVESRKPKIRRPDRPVIDDQDNSEI